MALIPKLVDVRTIFEAKPFQHNMWRLTVLAEYVKDIDFNELVKFNEIQNDIYYPLWVERVSGDRPMIHFSFLPSKEYIVVEYYLNRVDCVISTVMDMNKKVHQLHMYVENEPAMSIVVLGDKIHLSGHTLTKDELEPYLFQMSTVCDIDLTILKECIL